MTNITHNLDMDIIKLEAMLLDVFDFATDVKFETEPYSRDRRLLMAVTKDLEVAINMIQRRNEDNSSLYAVYHSPNGTIAYKFGSKEARDAFIEENGRDFCGIPYPDELSAIASGEMTVID